MGSNTPSLTALLGLLAIAGYQNRDKISEWLGNQSGGAAPAGGAGRASLPPAGSVQGGGMGGGLSDMLGGGLGGILSKLTGNHDANSFLGGGLNDLVDRFRQSGQGAAADSWVGSGPNQSIDPAHMEQAIGADTLSELTQQTGLSREEILSRLSRDLPGAIDQYTPDGRLPSRR